MILFMNGLARLFGPMFGALLVTKANTSVVMLAGGSFVLVSSALCFMENRREENIKRLKTMTHFELSFDKHD